MELILDGQPSEIGSFCISNKDALCLLKDMNGESVFWQRMEMLK